MRWWWRPVVALAVVPLAVVDWADDHVAGVVMLALGAVPFGAMALARRARWSMLGATVGLYALWFWFYRDAMAHRDPLPPAGWSGVVWLTVATVAAAWVTVADMRGADARRMWRGWAALVVTSVWCALFDLLVVAVLFDDHGPRMRAPTADDLRPLPATLRILSIGDCDGGSAGNCTRNFRIAATDGATRTVILDRLLGSLKANGWSITVTNGFADGCRPVPGRVEYTDHCLFFGVDRNPDWIGDVPPDQVVISIGDLD